MMALLQPGMLDSLQHAVSSRLLTNELLETKRTQIAVGTEAESFRHVANLEA